jgi:LacI family transcriptional regulator
LPIRSQPAANHRVSLEEIARLAGVSRSTVSRVVNGDRWVSAAARRRVEEAVRATNYHPHAAARSLATRRTRIIGLLIPHHVGAIFRDPFYPILVQGAVEACNEADHNLSVLMETADDAATSDRIYRRVIGGRHVDGVVIASSVVDDPIVAQLERDGFPFVLVGRHPRHEVSFVDVDNRGAAREAVAHLLAHGYRRIAMIAGPPDRIATIDRYAGYVTALQEAGYLPDPALTVHADFTRRGGYRAMQAVLAAAGATGPPDAVFVASDAMAYGALQALRDAGLRVPDDVAVMGFDGLEEVLVSLEILSTVVQPTVDEGREAVRILLELIEHPERAPIQRYLPTRLSLLRSCGCGPKPALNAAELATGGVAI